jgi:DNA-binding LytR/AlgR family response regulator
MINCIVVDDEQVGIDILRSLILKTPQLNLLASFLDPVEALDSIKELHPHLIFLDVDMPQFTGLDMIELLKTKLGAKTPHIILTTSHQEHALKGYELGVTDYLLKPISLKRFKLSIDRITEMKEETKEEVKAPPFFFVESEGKKVKIDFADVLYLESAGNYVKLITQKGRHTLYSSLSSLQTILPEDSFSRIHNSFIVAITQIQSVTRTEVVVGTGKEQKHIPIGVTFKEAFFKKLNL